MMDYWWMGFCVRELPALFERTGEYLWFKIAPLASRQTP
jgi:hypothetical protein